MKAGPTSRSYTSGRLDVQIKAPLGPLLVTSTTASTDFTYERKIQAIEQIQEHLATYTMDVDKIEGEALYELDAVNFLYLSARGTVVKIPLLWN